MAIDDHARIAFTPMPPDKSRRPLSSCSTPRAYHAALGVIVRFAYRQRRDLPFEEFAAACKSLNVKHEFTRPYRPQNNSEAERFIQSALREWAYGWTYQNSAERTDALAGWRAGSITTTGIDRTAASAASRLWPDSTRQETTS